MPRAYLRLDPAFDERKADYPDGPYAALIATLCLAEHQPHRGRFRNAGYLRALLGKRGRHVPYLIAHGDLVTQADGRLYLDGWDEWQEGDWKVAERVARIRERKRGNGQPPAPSNGGGNGPGNGQANGLPLGVSGGISGGGGISEAGAEQSAPDDPFDAPEMPALQWLVAHKVVLQPHDGYYRHLVMAVERHGVEAVVQVFDELHGAGMPDGDTKGYVFGARDELDRRKRPNLRAVEKAEDRAADSERRAGRFEATKARAHEIGYHADEPDPGCPKCREGAA
jgi:hypothetical protein